MDNSRSWQFGIELDQLISTIGMGARLDQLGNTIAMDKRPVDSFLDEALCPHFVN